MTEETFMDIKKFNGKKSINLYGHNVPILSVDEISQSINTHVFTDIPYYDHVEHIDNESINDAKVFYDLDIIPIEEFSTKIKKAPLFSTVFVPPEIMKIQGLIDLFVRHDNVYISAAPEVVMADVARAYNEIAHDTGDYANCMWVSKNMVVLMNLGSRCVNYYATANNDHEITRMSAPLLCRHKSMMVIKTGFNYGIHKKT